MNSATKFLCVKTSSFKVVGEPFPYLTVYKYIGGDVPFHVKFALKVTHPLWKASTSTDICFSRLNRKS